MRKACLCCLRNRGGRREWRIWEITQTWMRKMWNRRRWCAHGVARGMWRRFCMVCLRSLRNCSVSSLRARWCWAAATSTFSTRRRAITAMIARKSSDVRGSWCAAAERRRTLISRNRFCVKRDGGSCVLTLLVKRRSHRFRRLRSM